MRHIQILAKQTLIYGLGTFVPRLLNFALLTPLYTRELSIYDYGLFTELYSYAMVFMVILTFGMETTYFKFSADNPEKEKQIYSNILLFVSIISILFLGWIYFKSDHIKSLIDFQGESKYIKLFGFIICFDAISAIASARLRAKQNSLRFSIIKILNVSTTIVLVLLLFLGYSNFSNRSTFCSYILQQDNLYYIFLINAISSSVQLILFIPELVNITFKIEFRNFYYYLLYAVPLLISGFSGTINEVLDRLVLGHLIENRERGVEIVGIYGANYKLAVIMTIFIQMFRYAAEPYFFSLYKEKDAKSVYSSIMTYFVIFCSIIFLGVLLFIDITKNYLGKEFHEGLGVVPFVLFANILFGILVNINFWFKLSKKTIYAIIIFGAGSLITVFGNVLLVPHFSYYGSAFTHVLAYAGMILISFNLGKKFYPIRYNLKDITFYIGLALIIYFISLSYSNINLGLKIFINSILIFTYLYIVNRKEKLIKNLFKR